MKTQFTTYRLVSNGSRGSDMEVSDGKEFTCSFCGKVPKDVERVIAGPNANICDECVELSRDIIGAHRQRILMMPLEKPQSEEGK